MRTIIKVTAYALIVIGGVLFIAFAFGTTATANPNTGAVNGIGPSHAMTTTTPTPVPTQTLPDLTIVGMSISLSNTNCPSPNAPLGTYVFVKNFGAAAAGTFVVRLNNTTSQTVASLAASALAWVWFPTYISGFQGSSTAIVDPDDQIAESNESNNTFTTTLPVPTPPATCTPTPSGTLPPRAYFPWINRALPTFTPTPTPTPPRTPIPTLAVSLTPSPTSLTPTPTPTPILGAVIFQGTVQVSNIKYLGTEANEVDEYVEIKNFGTQPVAMDGWNLKAMRSADNQILDQYVFGNGFILAAGQVCRIYTDKLSPSDNCGTGYGFENPAPLWPNTGSARASLFNQSNVEMARFTY